MMVMTSVLEPAGEILLTLCFSDQKHSLLHSILNSHESPLSYQPGERNDRKFHKYLLTSGERRGEMRERGRGGQIGKLFSLECAAAVLAGDETLSVTL